MRLPGEYELSREQRDVMSASTDESLLVIGPPGTGKTVLAIYRHKAIEKLSREVTSTVHNHVLKSYCDLGNTFTAWLRKWWKNSTGKAIPMFKRPNSSFGKMIIQKQYQS